jgi:hypothetical protein
MLNIPVNLLQDDIVVNCHTSFTMTKLLACLLIISISAKAQTNTSASNSARLKVFVDCSNTWCDNTFIRSEINIVDFLLDRVAADVHILITSMQNGSGGSQYQMIFYGQNRFRNISDTLRYNLDPNATDSERRDAMVKYIKLGLTPLVMKTDYAGEISIQMKKPEQKSNQDNSNKNTTDKWNYWVFRLGASGNLSLDEVYKSSSYRTNISADRTTDKLKVYFGVDASTSISKYQFATPAGTEKIKVKNNSHSFYHSMVVSINQHWSYGYQANYSSSTFSNNKSQVSVSPSIEYAIFPYKLVNNKFLTLRYGLDFRQNRYYDTTVYGKTREALAGHNISANLSLNQKWGSISSNIYYRNYFSDWKLNNLSVNLDVNIRISGGLSFNVYTYSGLVRDQIYLPKGGATEQEILTRRRQLASAYNFYSGFGFNYRFGSKLNNFVNPRFN